MHKQDTHCEPIKFPRLVLQSARLNNLLLNKTAGFGFPLYQSTGFRFRMLPGDMAMQSLCPHGLTLELGNTVAGLWLSAWPLVERIRQYIPENLLTKLPENLAISVIENALEPLLQHAERGLGLKISLQSTSAQTDSPHYSLPLGFDMQVANMENNQVHFQGIGLLVLDPQLYPHLQERLRFWPSDNNADWEEHHTALHLEISRTVLTMQEMNQLQPSDLLLLDDTRFQQQGQIRLRLDSGQYCEATFTSPAKTALTLNSEWIPMSDNDPKPPVEHISQIPVQLAFDLGQKTLSFNEVRQLRPGYTLELGLSLPDIVQIRSQNRLIGTGELVEINGRVGIRILNLFSKKAKGS